MVHSRFLTQLLQRRTLLKWLGGSTAGLLFNTSCAPATPAIEPVVTPIATTGAATDAVVMPVPLRVAFTNAPNQLDPARMTTIEAYQIAFALFDALVWIDYDLNPQPLLALSWELTSDQLAWTFQLRRDVKFHNGADLTAQDVVYTFTRLLDAQFDSSLRAVLSFVAGVEAVDDYTVRFNLTTPNAELPFLVGSPQTGIIPNQTLAADLTTAPIGAGPFQFVEFVPGEQVRMARYPGYWETDSVTISELTYRYLPSFADQAAALVRGEIDLVPDISLPDLPTLSEHPEISLIEVPSGNYQTIVMQATEAPFTDLRVRQALKYCADRTALQQAVLQGRGEPGNDQPVAPVSPFWADLPLRGQDIAKARQLLADAGYAQGLQLSLITSSSRPGMVELALAFREMARPAGIDITVVRVPADVYWTDYGGKVPFHIGNWGFRPSIDETLRIAYHSRSQQNESKWSSPALDAMIETARSAADPAERKVLYAEIQKQIMEEGAVIIPYFRPVLTALRQTVQGFTPHPAGWLDFSDVHVSAA